jgi:hypothetical protein
MNSTADGRACDRERDVPLRVDHLLAGAAGQLEADEVEQQDTHQQHEAACRRLVPAGSEPVRAVLDRVDDHRDREQPEQEEAGECAGRGQPP